jgi:hypothetical protein
VTSFIKLGSDPSSVCSQKLTTDGPFDFDFNPTTTSRRSLLDDPKELTAMQPAELLSKRGVKLVLLAIQIRPTSHLFLSQDRAFPFNNNVSLAPGTTV